MPAPLPALRTDLSFVEQVYRGEKSYVVKDRAAQKYFRFGATEVRVMQALDGRHTAVETAALLAENGLRIQPAAIEAFARKLGGAGFLERTTAERSLLEMERLRAERRKRRRRALFRGELLRMRWSFGDPDALLERVLPGIRWMYTPAFVAASAVAFLVYFVVLGERWDAYAQALQSTYSLHALTIGSVVVLWCTGLAVVLIHELGHGFTCKYFGGEVHELGFMLLYFQPAFYCNVSDAWSFPGRGARLWVTAAGSWIQLIVASMAAVVWCAVAPGTLVAEICVAAMLIGGAMTLLTNANPLLPLDGYFALTDWLEIPNLRQRALAHFAWWLKRAVFRLELPEPQATFRERRVFLTYGALSATYIAVTFFVFAAFVLGWARQAFGALGTTAAAAWLVMLSRTSIVGWWRTAVLSARTHRARWRRRLRPLPVAAAIVAPLLVAALLPWPVTSDGAFVVHPASSSMLTTDAGGVVAEVLVGEGTRVAAGAPVARLVDRALERELLDASRIVDSLTAFEAAVRAAGRVSDAEQLAASRQSALARWTALDERASRLTLRAPIDGVVATRHPEELTGRRVAPGDTLLVLAALDSVEIRIALTGAGATRARAGQPVRLVSYADVAHPWTGALVEVSLAGARSPDAGGAVEARVRMPAEDAWRPGVRGEASVELERGHLLGAIAWKLRQLVRTDLWL